MKISRRVNASLAGVVVLVAVAISVSLLAFRQIEMAAEARKHTNSLIIDGNALLSALRDAETGERGYSLTGDNAFLEPYVAVRDGIVGHLEAMRRMTLVVPAQQHLDALAPLVSSWMGEIARVIELRRAGDMPAVLSTVAHGDAKRLMDSIRAEIGSYIRIEERLLAQNEEALRSTMRQMFVTIVAASLLTLVLALLFAYFVQRESRHRLEHLVHLETQHLLADQQTASKRLAQANLTLQISETRLEVTLNSIGDGLIATDADGRVKLLNPVAERLTGWTQQEAVDQPVDEIFRAINQETRQPSTLPTKETLAQGPMKWLANHTLLIARDGSECAIADSCAPIRDHDGAVVGAVLVFRDVSEEDAARLALRDSAALIQTILDTVADGIITLRAASGIVETANAAAERMFGYTAAELVGKNFSLLIPEFDSDPRNGLLEYYRASDEARAAGIGREITGQRKDGSRFALEIAVSDMSLGGKRYFTGILRDITAREEVKAEQERLSQRLRDYQFYTRSLFESNIDALITTDPSGIITDVNKQMEILTGSTRDELIGAWFKNSFTDPDRAEAGIKAVLNERKVTDYELTARARDGTETVVSYNATTFYDRDRRLQGVFAAARDVTERKRLDQVLQEKNAALENATSVAEKANLAKSDFLSSMSHELRTPLSAILGFAQLMESGLPAPSLSQKRSLDQILKAGWYLLDLINEILDLALIESGKLSLSLEPILLAEVMNECRNMIEPEAEKRGIGVTFPEFEAPVLVNADRTRLKQVLINLLSNAMKYNKAGGTIVVDCTRNDHDRLRIAVTDTGEGLPPDKIAQLFQQFNRLGREANVEEGTGIGLVVCKRLLELMGGVIGVESSVGLGSVFWIELDLTAEWHPAADTPERLGLPQDPVHPDGRMRTLLYVEDNPANLMLVEDLIARRSGMRLLSARDGNRGVEIARACLPDIILMDINLPGISGIRALQMLAEDPLTAHIPVIALSANAIPRDIARGLEAGFFRYLTKPIKVKEFMETLDVTLEFATAKSARIDGEATA